MYMHLNTKFDSLDLPSIEITLKNLDLSDKARTDTYKEQRLIKDIDNSVA